MSTGELELRFPAHRRSEDAAFDQLDADRVPSMAGDEAAPGDE